MKLEALHNFTSRLPLINDIPESIELTGQNTRSSILSGVVNNTRFEIQGVIDAYERKHKDLKIILSGGDSNFFDKRLKNSIFAVPNAVAVGLNEILDFNEQKH
jgi:type III pantothenate kinase